MLRDQPIITSASLEQATSHNLVRFLSTLRYSSPSESPIQWNEWTWRGLQNELLRFHIPLRESEANRPIIIELVNRELRRLRELDVRREDLTVEGNNEIEQLWDITGEGADTTRVQSITPQSDIQPTSNSDLDSEASTSRARSLSDLESYTAHDPRPSQYHTDSYLHEHQVVHRNSTQTLFSTCPTLLHAPSHLRHHLPPPTLYRRVFLGLCKVMEIIIPIDCDEDKVLGPWERRRIGV